MTVVRSSELLSSLATRTQTDALVMRDCYAQTAARATLVSQESGSPKPFAKPHSSKLCPPGSSGQRETGRVHRQSPLGEPWIKPKIIVRSGRPGRKAETVASLRFRESKERSQTDFDRWTRNVFNLRVHARAPGRESDLAGATDLGRRPDLGRQARSSTS